MKINIGSTYGPDAPVHFGQVKFKELVEQRSNGQFQVQIHVGGAMGGERDVFEGMSSGGLEMGAMGSGDTVDLLPQIPGLRGSLRDARRGSFLEVLERPGRQGDQRLSLKERGVMTAGVVYRGARYLTANKPIKTLAELKGLKIRLPENKVWIKIWETLGALPVVVAFPEVYMALKTGVAEAQENPMESIWAYKFYEAQKYLIAHPARLLRLQVPDLQEVVRHTEARPAKAHPGLPGRTRRSSPTSRPWSSTTSSSVTSRPRE